MSYSAFVECNCYKEGKTTIPPSQEYVKFTDDGLFLEIPEQLWNENEDDCFKIDNEFDTWKQNACEHEDMEYATEHLCNISGMNAFRQVIASLNKDGKFNTIHEALPTANGGCLKIEKMTDFLNELQLFKKINADETKIKLVDKQTEKLIAICNENDYQLFAFFNINYSYGFDKNGFFVLRSEKENDEEVYYEVFRSSYFSIRSSDRKNFEIVCEKTIHRFKDAYNLAEQEEFMDRRYYLIKKEITQSNDYYNYIVEPLINLAKASLVTGNPIHWC